MRFDRADGKALRGGSSFFYKRWNYNTCICIDHSECFCCIITLANELNQPPLLKEYIFVLFLKVFEDRLYLNKLVLFIIEGEFLPLTAFLIPLAALLYINYNTHSFMVNVQLH